MSGNRLVLSIVILSTLVALAGLSLSLLRPACTYGDDATCLKGLECVFTRPGYTRCLARHKGPLLSLRFPFEPAHPFICTQGNKSAEGRSHSYANTLYALDLTSPAQAASGEIYAGADGTVLVSSGCGEQDDKCGAGFGNTVRLLTEDGFLVLYAHLRDIFVSDGQKVKAGAILGLEGKSGAAGHRHLHLSVHANWRQKGLDHYRQHPAALPSSIPFQLKLCLPRAGAKCQGEWLPSTDIPWRDNDLKQPWLYGRW